jgi:hypothetical protein
MALVKNWNNVSAPALIFGYGAKIENKQQNSPLYFVKLYAVLIVKRQNSLFLYNI